MVNNNQKVGGRILSLSNYFSFIFLILFSLYLVPCTAKAQSIENRYQSHLNADGVTYFIRPKHIGHHENINGFNYDITYHTSKDSVILNFSIMTKKPVKVDGLVLSCGEKKYVGSGVSALYVDIFGDKYEIRTTSRFSLKDVWEVYSQKEALCFGIHFDNGEEGSATYSLSKWKKDSKMISRILDLINLQR